jgi:hypothetical protein
VWLQGRVYYSARPSGTTPFARTPGAGHGVFVPPAPYPASAAGARSPAIPEGWESIMGSTRTGTQTDTHTQSAAPLITRCDFTADSSRTAGPAAGQDAAGLAGPEAVDALEDALDRLYQNQVRSASHHPPAPLTV